MASGAVEGVGGSWSVLKGMLGLSSREKIKILVHQEGARIMRCPPETSAAPRDRETTRPRGREAARPRGREAARPRGRKTARPRDRESPGRETARLRDTEATRPRDCERLEGITDSPNGSTIVSIIESITESMIQSITVSIIQEPEETRIRITRNQDGLLADSRSLWAAMVAKEMPNLE